jgi:hypothetical protein
MLTYIYPQQTSPGVIECNMRLPTPNSHERFESIFRSEPHKLLTWHKQIRCLLLAVRCLLSDCRLRQCGGIDFSGGKAGTAFETREKLERPTFENERKAGTYMPRVN